MLWEERVDWRDVIWEVVDFCSSVREVSSVLSRCFSETEEERDWCRWIERTIQLAESCAKLVSFCEDLFTTAFDVGVEFGGEL